MAEVRHFDPGGILTVGVEGIDGGDEEDVGAAILASEEVSLFVARVGFEILIRPELRRVYEVANDDEVGFISSGANEGCVTVVEVAHGRHEGDGLTILMNFER